MRRKLKRALKETYPCAVCGEQEYALLDAHRVIPGQEGGHYSEANVVVLCANCHRRAHSGGLVIRGRHRDSLGRWFLHYVLDGEEKWALLAPKERG